MMKKSIATLVVIAAAFALPPYLGRDRVIAHKAVTSKYTYNDDVFPIFREKCTPCHVEGGVAPMSLMTYELAFPWAESIRAELIASHMPPWNADEGVGAFKHARRLTPKEIDVILTWATGGNPKGQIDQEVPKVPLKNDWAIGKPDLALPLPAEFTLPEDKMEDTASFKLSTGLAEPRWIRAVDLLPGTPSIVRSATISMPCAPASRDGVLATECELAHWVPGHDPAPADEDIGYLLPPNAQLDVRIHFKKTWQYDGKKMTDRSSVGLYFSPKSHPLMSMAVAAPADAAAKDQTIAFSHSIAQDVDAVAIVPEQVPPNIVVTADVVLPNGTRTPLIKLNTRADWVRRYWFAKPIALRRGARIDVVAKLEDPDLLSSAFSVTPPRPAATAAPIILRLDVVPDRNAPAAQ